jgi:quercetin dioxygenase-like cupin family protein
MNALRSLQATLEAEGYVVALYLLAPGTTFNRHCAVGRRLDAVLSGHLRWEVAGETHLLGPGDWIEIPAGAMVSAEVVGDEPVLGLDACPARD